MKEVNTEAQFKIPIVTSNDPGIRPAGKPNECFYCKSEVGTPHDLQCVIIKKRILAKYSFLVELEVPSYWSAAEFEFHRNNSCWCASNALDEIEKSKVDNNCLCDTFTAEFIKVIRDEPKILEESEAK